MPTALSLPRACTSLQFAATTLTKTTRHQPKLFPSAAGYYTSSLRTRSISTARSPFLTNNNGNSRYLTRRGYTTTVQLRAAMAASTDTAAAEEATTSGITPDSLKATLTEKLGAEYVDVEDMSGGCGQAFQAIIVSSQFDKKTLLARHRLVNSALKTEIAAIHAWTPKCYTPGQWEKLQSGMA